MNIDASKAEDTNIPQIKECLLLSCVASFEDWSSIFRTLKTINGAEMADVEQTQKMVPLITCEISLR